MEPVDCKGLTSLLYGSVSLRFYGLYRSKSSVEKKMCDLVMKIFFTASAEAEQTLLESAGAHLMQGCTPGEMAPGFYCSQTACPAQPFWEKFMAPVRGKGFILPGCSKSC